MKKVLIVDDDENILDALSLILEEAGYQVTQINNGEKTYETVLSFQPDLILLDILMSGSDGRTICANLKKEPQTKKIPVIMVAAHRFVGQESQKCGADDFLAKPFDMDDLLGKVEKYIGGATL